MGNPCCRACLFRKDAFQSMITRGAPGPWCCCGHNVHAAHDNYQISLAASPEIMTHISISVYPSTILIAWSSSAFPLMVGISNIHSPSPPHHIHLDGVSSLKSRMCPWPTSIDRVVVNSVVLRRRKCVIVSERAHKFVSAVLYSHTNISGSC